MSKALTELVTPASDGLVCHDHAALEQQLFDVAQAQLEVEISSNRATDDASRKTVAVIERCRFPHRAILSDRPLNLTTPASDMPGADLLRSVREVTRQYLTVIFVSTRGRDYDVTSILDAGADDYIVKPVSGAVLLARVCALLRRVYRNDPAVTHITFGDFVFDLASECVLWQGMPMELRRREFELALLLFRNMGRPLSRVHIAELVWKQAADIPSRTMDTPISMVRTKLGLRPENGYRLTPIYGYGYRLEQIACDGGSCLLEKHRDAAMPTRH